jgi:hypothetical protein
MNIEAITAQENLLQAHRQTLHVLLTQQAQFGIAYTPPAVVHGIRNARAAIAEIKQNLKTWGVQVADSPDDTEAHHSSEAGVTASTSGAPQAGGDIIMATIGAGAQGIAVGKNIQQTIGTTSTAAEDRHTIEALLAQVAHEIAASHAESATQAMATFQLRLLTGELAKTDTGSVPSGSTISQVVDGLLDGIPTLKATLSKLFRHAAVVRVVQRADTSLERWLTERFGNE